MTQYILGRPTVWSNTAKYEPAAIGQIVAIPMVTYSGRTYYLNGSANPVVGTAPASDAAWSVMGDSANYMPLVPGAVQNNVATFDTGGKVKDSGVSISTNPNVHNNTTLWTSEATNTVIQNTVVGVYKLQGGYDPTITSQYPTAANTTNPVSPNVLIGMVWSITAAGIINGNAVAVGNQLIALVDNPGQTETNWNIVADSSVAGVYVPSAEVVTGAQSVSAGLADYSSNTSAAGGIFYVKVPFNVLSNESPGDGLTDGPITIKIPLPPAITANFTAVNQASITAQANIIETAKYGEEGNSGSGWSNNIEADTASNSVFFTFEVSQPNVEYFVTVSFTGQIQ